jgi:hypothetical protein
MQNVERHAVFLARPVTTTVDLRRPEEPRWKRIPSRFKRLISISNRWHIRHSGLMRSASFSVCLLFFLVDNISSGITGVDPAPNRSLDGFVAENYTAGSTELALVYVFLLVPIVNDDITQTDSCCLSLDNDKFGLNRGDKYCGHHTLSIGDNSGDRTGSRWTNSVS